MSEPNHADKKVILSAITRTVSGTHTMSRLTPPIEVTQTELLTKYGTTKIEVDGVKQRAWARPFCHWFIVDNSR